MKRYANTIHCKVMAATTTVLHESDPGSVTIWGQMNS